MRGGGQAWTVLALVLGLLAADAAAQIAPTEAIRPVKEYDTADARAVAEAHARELRGLYDEVRRCAPELEFQRHGIGFRRPRGVTDAAPHLTVWVWLPPAQPLRGGDLGTRTANAFARYARRLLARALALGSVSSDARVGGYILVLSWVGPEQTGSRPIAESLVLYADKSTAADFVSGALPASDFLTRVGVRTFDGQTEVKLDRLAVGDGAGGAVPSAC